MGDSEEAAAAALLSAAAQDAPATASPDGARTGKLITRFPSLHQLAFGRKDPSLGSVDKTLVARHMGLICVCSICHPLSMFPMRFWLLFQPVKIPGVQIANMCPLFILKLHGPAVQCYTEFRSRNNET